VWLVTGLLAGSLNVWIGTVARSVLPNHISTLEAK